MPLISTRVRWGCYCCIYKGGPGNSASWKYSGRPPLCPESDWTTIRLLREAISLSCLSVLLCLRLSRSAVFLPRQTRLHGNNEVQIPWEHTWILSNQYMSGRAEPFGTFPSWCGETDGTNLTYMTTIISRFQCNQRIYKKWGGGALSD